MGTSDVLSNVLEAVRLTGAVYFDFNLTAPWVAEAPQAREIASRVMPGAQRVIEYHLMAEGHAWARVVGEPAIRLREGDLIVFPQGDAHVLASHPDMRATPDLRLYARTSAAQLPLVYELDGGGVERARIVCCFLGCDERPFNPLLAALPRAIHLSTTDARSATSWLATLFSMAVRESQSGRVGSENILARLSELMFVETVRQHVEGLPPGQTGWLGGLRDPVVGQALGSLHRDPKAAWTVESLARAVGVSRSVLAERFAETVGQPPMQYLASWRMQLAARLLRDGASVVAAAEAVGYDSEAAFSRAFKKLVGQSPGAWRRRADSV